MRQLILGTDWWTDCDDAVALRLLSRCVKAGKIDLLGIAINACMPYSVASMKGFLQAEGIDGVPLGIDLTALEFGGTPLYQKGLAERFYPQGSNAEAEDALRLYRRILAGAKEPVEIVEIGFLQVVAALLASGADDISDKTGEELVREKVSRFWVMAGKWDADGEREHNFCLNPRTREAGRCFCERCPVPITFLGWEVGYDVITGAHLSREDHLYGVMLDHGSPNGRSSWDPMLMLLAMVGDEREAGYDVVRGRATVDADTGANHFAVAENGMHAYVVKRQKNAYYQSAIDQIIQ